MSQGNHMNLDIGTIQSLFLDRTRVGAESVDTRKDDGSRHLLQKAAIEQGMIKGFLHAGKQVQLLTPKKDELDSWAVLVENNNGVFAWRLDLIVGACRLPDPAPTKNLAQAVHEAVEGEYIPQE